MGLLDSLGSAIYGGAANANAFMDDPLGSIKGLLSSRLAELAAGAKSQLGGANPLDPSQRDAAVQQMTANAPNFGLLAMPTVYHGTPHNIQGTYDLSKIGTGEGAQAYGHGIYFAENPSTARSYQNALAQDNTPIISSRQMAIDSWRTALSREQDPKMRQIYEANIKGAQKELAEIGPAKTGNLYQQTLPDSVLPRMLQWDKPLSEQPEAVKKALEPIAQVLKIGPDHSGAEILQAANKARIGWFDNPRPWDAPQGVLGPEYLKRQGIPGLSYLDAGSRPLQADAMRGVERVQAKLAKLRASGVDAFENL